MDDVLIEIPQSLKDLEPKMQASHRTWCVPGMPAEPSDWGKDKIERVKQALTQDTQTSVEE